jgi:hypothetical protein
VCTRLRNNFHHLPLGSPITFRSLAMIRNITTHHPPSADIFPNKATDMKTLLEAFALADHLP